LRKVEEISWFRSIFLIGKRHDDERRRSERARRERRSGARHPRAKDFARGFAELPSAIFQIERALPEC
jgi:hypothetical protein